MMLRIVRFTLGALSYIAPSVAGRIATFLWFTPYPLARPAAPRIPTGAQRITLGSGESVVRGYELGNGPRTALLIHGWAGSSVQYRRIASALSDAGYRSVVIDLPGHGVEAGRATDAYELARAIEIAGAAIGKIDMLVAHSLGAMSAGVALQRSLVADRVVLVAPGVKPHAALETFAIGLRLRPVVWKAVEREMESRFGADLWDRIPDQMMAMNVPDATLVIHDVDDDMIPISHADLLSEQWGVRILRTEGHGHNGVLRAQEVIDQIVSLASEQLKVA